ncbi:ATP-binding protein [Frankia sp. R82]|uniref:ATP-binding protein n=1 Tax=Frankia sp. R82 TaxID=2950553 RepID=UPI0020448268|nr:ATP-binding protein [Frankia sp. R82]MCM3883080.1 ATP-binding protein [Frankia sp. R82]
MITALAPASSTAPDPPAGRLPQHVRHYPATPRTASAARRDATAQLHRWGLDTVTDTVTLVLSELITNALVASSRPSGVHGADEAASRVAMRLTYSHRDLIVEVWDGGPGRPTCRTTDTDTDGGRGLHIVATVARALGYYPVRVRSPDGYRTRGKIVWAALSHETPATPHLLHSPAEQLPRRIPASPTAEATLNPDSYDHALLQRVLDGLRNLDTWTPSTAPTSPAHHPVMREQEATP